MSLINLKEIGEKKEVLKTDGKVRLITSAVYNILNFHDPRVIKDSERQFVRVACDPCFIAIP